MKLYRALPAVPAVALIGAGWFANRLEPSVLGLPFLLAWIVAWVLGTSLSMWIVYRLDRRQPDS
ncbi:MAG: DUF3311 domain-containing protein [Gemmatimonadetes bacterium]|nr:DUF3311 domain-containing protein [Gemmatimonadota bacterium]